MTGVYQSDVRANNRQSRRGLPMGNQFMGRAYDEHRIVAIARGD